MRGWDVGASGLEAAVARNIGKFFRFDILVSSQRHYVEWDGETKKYQCFERKGLNCGGRRGVKVLALEEKWIDRGQIRRRKEVRNKPRGQGVW
jgi:hypothetical protein